MISSRKTSLNDKKQTSKKTKQNKNVKEKIKPFKPEHKFPYSPYSFLYSCFVTDKENLINNQNF